MLSLRFVRAEVLEQLLRLRKLKRVIKSKSGLIEINDPNFYVKFIAPPLLNASTQTFYPYSSGRPS